MDGWVTIGARLDTKQLEKDLKTEETRLRQFERENQKLTEKKEKVETNLKPYYQEISLAKELTNEILKQTQTKKEVDNALKTEEIRIQEINEKYASQLNQLSGINKKIAENEYQQGLVNNNIQEMNQKLGKTNGKDLSGIKNSIEGIGSSIQKVTKKVVKWGLAIFGVRSMYMLVRQSVSTLSQYDDQLASNLEYVRYAIAVALKPVIEYIVSLVYKLLAYVNYLAKAWFKIDLFANASAQGFKDAKDNAKGLNKELNKTIAGFDEMNTLQSNNNGTDTGVAMPSYDLSKMQDVKIPKWLKWIKDHGAEIATILGLIIGSKILGTGLLGLTGLASTLATIGIIAIGVDLFYKALTGRDLVQDLKDIYNGFKELEKAKKQNEKMDKEVIGTTKDIVKNNKEVAKGYEKGSQEIARMTGALRSNIEMSTKEIQSGKYSLEQIKRRDELIKESIETYKALYEQGKLTNGQTEDYINLMAKLGLKADGTKMSFQEYTEYLRTHYDKEVQDAKQETSIFGNALANLVGREYSIEIDTQLNPPDTQRFINSINEVIRRLNLNDMARMAVSGATLGYLYNKQIPYLAKGGIVNLPGKGVPIGGAFAGERQAEGVVPLTDSQQMSLLGEAIGRYITVNLTNITKLDGRQIARKVDKVNQSNDFVFNR